MEQDFSYRGISQLCGCHIEEIIEKHSRPHDSYTNFDDLYRLLEYRDVRFIDPLGRFQYTKFGHFYFDKKGVMMLITDNWDYARCHRPDKLSHTLWSTVPVIFAGIDTRIIDDCNQPIFTGDIVTDVGNQKTSYVRYLHPTIPGLAEDNCELQYDLGSVWHKEGTVFSGISHKLYKQFDESVFRWPITQFYPNSMTREEVKERANLAWSNPVFCDSSQPIRPQRRGYGESVEEVLCDRCVLAYFRGSESFIDADGSRGYEIFCDNYPEGYRGKSYGIKIPRRYYYLEKMKPRIDAFLLHAHKHPKTTFVLCDFTRKLLIPDLQLDKWALLFHDWFTFNIPNVILPGWILFRLGPYECYDRY
jgi:hypothetical protein